MRKFITYLTVMLLLGIPAQASERGYVIWLGPNPLENTEALKLRGYSPLWLRCDVVSLDCLKGALRNGAPGKPTYLFAEAAYSRFVGEIYKSSIKRSFLSGIVMFRARQLEGFDVALSDEAPSLMVLVTNADEAEQIYQSRQFANQLIDAGVDGRFLFAGRGALDGSPMPRMTMDLFAYFAGHSLFSGQFEAMLKAYETWEEPLFSYGDFYANPDLLSTRPMPDMLRQLFRAHYSKEPHQLAQWKFETYTSFDLLKYRDLVAPGKRYATLRNIRDQVIFLDLEKYSDYGPEIVLGVDDVENLYSMYWLYQTLSMYSWKGGKQDVSVRLLGPMLYMRKEAEQDIDIPLLLRSALSLEGITFSDDDPLAPIEKYPEGIQQVITTENKCIYCHSIEGLGGQYHHITALEGEPQGGIALPLKDYPPEVMEAFLFDQVNTAAKIGMTPNPLKESVAVPFHEWWQSLVAQQAEVSTLPPVEVE